MDTIVTRFAPSPTGYLHIGVIRTALINYILTNQAKKKYTDSKFFLRIEDTDKKRLKQEYVDSIINGLKWLNINWDGEIYFQSKRISRHQEIAVKLLETKKAFKCICTQEQIKKKREENLKNNINIKRLCVNCEFNQQIQNLKKEYCIRIKIPNEGNILIKDMIRGKVEIKNIEIDNFIILRSDLTPTYMLSVVVDDHDMNINNIIRGDDHFNNTFRQYHIYKQLGWKIPNYAHLPLIHGLDGSKLSKRHGAIDINEFKKKGYLPKAIINNLILLGWSPKNNDEFIEIDEIIKRFDIKNLSKSSSIFDYQKLDFLNNFYLQKEDNYMNFIKYIENNDLIKSYLKKDQEKIKKIYNAHKNKVKKLFEYIEIIKVYFDIQFVTKPDDILNENFKNLLNKLLKKLENVERWDEASLEFFIKNFINEDNIKFATFGKSLRHILINSKHGISISLVMFILGKEIAVLRIKNYIK